MYKRPLQALEYPTPDKFDINGLLIKDFKISL